MVGPVSLVNVLSFGRAECPGQSEPARRGTPGVVTIALAKGGRWLGCSPSELHTQVGSDLEQLLLGFDGHLLQGHHLHTIMATTKTPQSTVPSGNLGPVTRI